MTRSERDDLAAGVVIGSTWFVLGDHYRVVEERQGRDLVGGEREREVRLEPCRPERVRAFKHEYWVAAWRVARYGMVSEAYSTVEA